MENGLNDGSRWRLSKDIPISVVGFILLQTIGLTWYAAGQSASLHSVVVDNESRKNTEYTKEDARHEREFMDQKFLLLENKNEEITRRLALAEAALLVDIKNRPSNR